MDAPSSFADEFNRLRSLSGLSLRDLSAATHFSRSLLGKWGTGGGRPTPEDARRLDQVLNGQGALEAASRRHLLTNGSTGRLTRVAARPRSVDAAAVDSLTVVLAQMRRLEDSVGAGALLVATAGPLQLVEQLADEARGPIRRRVVDLAGQWAQFAGWLRAATGNAAKAREWYGRTLEYATEARNENLIATALSMRGHLAWMLRQLGPVVGLSAAALDEARSPGVRAMAAQQEARGYALLGERDDAMRMLDQADAEMDAARDHPDEEPPWTYFFSPGYLRMQRGLAHRLLGDHEEAIVELTRGLEAAGDVTSSEFVASYVVHLIEEHLALGDRAAAAELLEQARAVAQATGSAKLGADVARLERRISG